MSLILEKYGDLLELDIDSESDVNPRNTILFNPYETIAKSYQNVPDYQKNACHKKYLTTISIIFALSFVQYGR